MHRDYPEESRTNYQGSTGTVVWPYSKGLKGRVLDSLKELASRQIANPGVDRQVDQGYWLEKTE